MKSPAVVPPKRPYQVPKLLVYGDLTEMTKAMALGGRPDGGTKVAMKRTG